MPIGRRSEPKLRLECSFTGPAYATELRDENLLTRGTVVVQGLKVLRGRKSRRGRHQWNYLPEALRWYLRRQNFQSSRVTLSIALAALCSQRFFRLARSRLSAGIDL